MTHQMAMKDAARAARDEYNFIKERMLNQGYGMKMAVRTAKDAAAEVLTAKYVEYMSQDAA